MTEPRTNLKRRTLLVGVTGVALEAMGTLALRWRPGRRACGSRLTSQAIGASAAPEARPSDLPGAPKALWPGYVDATSVSFMWWGPPEQVDWSWQNHFDYYRVYRDGVLIYGDGVGGAPNPGGVTPNTKIGHPSPYFADNGVTPNTSHRYYVTAVKSGREKRTIAVDYDADTGEWCLGTSRAAHGPGHVDPALLPARWRHGVAWIAERWSAAHSGQEDERLLLWSCLRLQGIIGQKRSADLAA